MTLTDVNQKEYEISWSTQNDVDRSFYGLLVISDDGSKIYLRQMNLKMKRKWLGHSNDNDRYNYICQVGTLLTPVAISQQLTVNPISPVQISLLLLVAKEVNKQICYVPMCRAVEFASYARK